MRPPTAGSSSACTSALPTTCEPPSEASEATTNCGGRARGRARHVGSDTTSPTGQAYGRDGRQYKAGKHQQPDTATPRLVYNDDCGFCKWAVRWLLRFGEFDPVGYGELTPDEKARLPDEYDDCMHLLTDDAVYSCGEAFEQCLVRTGRVGSALV